MKKPGKIVTRARSFWQRRRGAVSSVHQLRDRSQRVRQLPCLSDVRQHGLRHLYRQPERRLCGRLCVRQGDLRVLRDVLSLNT